MTDVRAAQAIQESIASNPSPDARAAQGLMETVAANPSPPARAAQAIMEVITSSQIPRYKGVEPHQIRLSDGEPEDDTPWRAYKARRYVPPSTGYSGPPPPLRRMLAEPPEDTTPWLNARHLAHAFSQSRPYLQVYV